MEKIREKIQALDIIWLDELAETEELFRQGKLTTTDNFFMQFMEGLGYPKPYTEMLISRVYIEVYRELYYRYYNYFEKLKYAVNVED